MQTMAQEKTDLGWQVARFEEPIFNVSCVPESKQNDTLTELFLNTATRLSLAVFFK